MEKDRLIKYIDQNIKDNLYGLISPLVLRDVLIEIVNFVDERAGKQDIKIKANNIKINANKPMVVCPGCGKTKPASETCCQWCHTWT